MPKTLHTHYEIETVSYCFSIRSVIFLVENRSLSITRLKPIQLTYPTTIHALPDLDGRYIFPSILGDVNSDGTVNILDLVLVANNLGVLDPILTVTVSSTY